MTDVSAFLCNLSAVKLATLHEIAALPAVSKSVFPQFALPVTLPVHTCTSKDRASGEFTAIGPQSIAHNADNEREFDLSMQPFRFIHAANLLLDHQLQQIDYADPHLTAIAEDSTLAAFRQLVRTAVDEQVDFLLLTGNCFDAADQSLLAEIALLRGLEELDEQGIDVYIVPGEADPSACWSIIAAAAGKHHDFARRIARTQFRETKPLSPPFTLHRHCPLRRRRSLPHRVSPP